MSEKQELPLASVPLHEMSQLGLGHSPFPSKAWGQTGQGRNLAASFQGCVPSEGPLSEELLPTPKRRRVW